VRTAHPGVQVDLKQAVGENMQVVDLLARIALE
jgi:hypothetical protein